MLTNKQLSQQIQDRLKVAGIPRAAYSIRVRDAGYSTSVNLWIKDISVNPSEVEQIAGAYESIRRCEYTGEILEGCNTYVFVQYDGDALKAAGAAFLDKARAVLADPPPIHNGRTIMEKDGLRLLFMNEGDGNVQSQLIIFDDKGWNIERGRRTAYSAEKMAEGMAIFNALGTLKLK